MDKIGVEEPTPIPHEEVVDTILYGKEKADFDKSGYIIRNRFPYGTSEPSLSFILSNTRVGLEVKPIDTSDEKNISFSVSSDENYSYQVIAVQQKVLISSAGNKIDNTVCNLPKLPCTMTFARPWTDPGAYGFGYRLSGDDTSYDFHDSNSYRSFPLNSKSEFPVTILENQNTSGTKQFQMFLKINFPPSYQMSTYVTDISLFILPKL